MGVGGPWRVSMDELMDKNLPYFVGGNLGPDLQNILRQSYDYLTIMPKLRPTYEGRLIYKTSYEGRKAVLCLHRVTVCKMLTNYSWLAISENKQDLLLLLFQISIGDLPKKYTFKYMPVRLNLNHL